MKVLEPWLLWLETTNQCNARPPCVYCNTQYGLREPQDMDFDLYKRIIDSCTSSEEVHPQGLGEPLLYPHFIEAVAYAKKKDKKVLIYTNASLLDNDMAERLLDIGLDEIRFSVDGHNKDTYEAARPGLPWKTVLANIESFQRLKDRGGYSTRTMIRICIIEETESLLKDMINFWRNRVDVVATVKELYVPPLKLTEKFASGKHFKCKQPFRNLSVLSNGDLVLCCRDGSGSCVIANLNEETDILKAYNNEKFASIRMAIHESKDYPYCCHVCSQTVKKGTSFER